MYLYASSNATAAANVPLRLQGQSGRLGKVGTWRVYRRPRSCHACCFGRKRVPGHLRDQVCDAGTSPTGRYRPTSKLSSEGPCPSVRQIRNSWATGNTRSDESKAASGRAGRRLAPALGDLRLEAKGLRGWNYQSGANASACSALAPSLLILARMGRMSAQERPRRPMHLGEGQWPANLQRWAPAPQRRSP